MTIPVTCKVQQKVDVALRLLEHSKSRLRHDFGIKLQSVLGARVDFEDFLQDVRVRIIRGVGLMDAQTDNEMSGWIFAVARNVYKDLLTRHLAQKRNATRESLGVSLDTEFIDNEDDIKLIIELNEDVERLERAIERLPLNQARAVRMQYFGLLNSTEIAIALNVSVGAARSLVCRGLASVRTEFQKEVHLFDLKAGEIRSITAVLFNTAEVDYMTDAVKISNFLETNGDIKLSKRDSIYVSANPVYGRFSCVSVALKSA